MQEDSLARDADYRAYAERIEGMADSAFGVFDYDPEQVFGVATDETGKRKRGRRRKGEPPAPPAAKLVEKKRTGDGDDDEEEDVCILPGYVDSLGGAEGEFAAPSTEADVEEVFDTVEDAYRASEMRFTQQPLHTKLKKVFTDGIDLSEASNPSAGEKRRHFDSEKEAALKRLINEQTIPGAIPAVPFIFVRNLVMTCASNMPINFTWILQRSARFGFFRNERRFAALIYRCLNPRTSTLAFANGKFVNTGAQQLPDARLSIERMVRIIADFEDEDGSRPYANMKVCSIRVHNMVGSTSVPFRIDLEVLILFEAVRFPKKKVFCGAIFTVASISSEPRNANAKALIFESGNIIIMGAKSAEHISEVYALIYPYVARAAVQDRLPQALRVTEAQMRRANSEKRRVSAIPADSGNVIAIQPEFQVAEFHRVNDNRMTGRQMLEMQQQSEQNTLAGIDQTSKNLIALHTVNQKQSDSAARLAIEPAQKAKRVRKLGRADARAIGGQMQEQ